MTHLPFIAGAYALAVVIPGWFAVAAWRRLALAKRRLKTLDPRLQG
jgi:hypothetical protein